MTLAYKKCPNCGHEPPPGSPELVDECPGCGVIFEKWLRRRLQPEKVAATPLTRRSVTSGWLLGSTDPADPWRFRARVALYLCFLVWGIGFLMMDYKDLENGLPEINRSFLHGVNLVFHEAGHVLFRPFGDFMSVLGGSLGQLMIPAIAVLAFLRERDPFAASLGLWWLGQSLLDLAPYVYDARAGQMVLLGGVTGTDAPGYHDWTNLLTRMDALHSYRGLALSVYLAGLMFMLMAFSWGAVVLWRQRERRLR